MKKGQLMTLEHCDPAAIPFYICVAAPLGINGVHQPFWRDWVQADPSLFLTPDTLHAWHKFFFDHVIKWIITIMGGEELDRRMCALPICVGVCHWSNGISKLKQCTGREHRDLKRIIVAVIASAVDDQILCAIRALTEFIFQAQSLLLYNEQLHAIKEALREFHHYKDAIIKAGGRHGKNGLIMHFNMPKLEGMARAAYNARQMGAPYQFTSDVTERCHITHIKTPYRHSNRRNFQEQCCHFMDHVEKSRLFDLFTLLSYGGASLLNIMVDEASEIANYYPEATWLSHVLPADEYRLHGAASRPLLFNKSRSQQSDDLSTAFLVTLKPHHPRLLVYDTADRFHLPDFRGALGDYFVLKQNHLQRHGQWKSSKTCALPFLNVDIWINFRMQQRSTQDASILLPTWTVQALPPSLEMLFGRCNTVLVNDRNGSLTMSSGGDREFPPTPGQLHLLISFSRLQGCASSDDLLSSQL